LLITQQPLKLEKNKRRFGILRILENFQAGLAKFENNQILLYKISCRPLTTMKLFFWVKDPHCEKVYALHKMYF